MEEMKKTLAAMEQTVATMKSRIAVLEDEAQERDDKPSQSEPGKPKAKSKPKAKPAPAASSRASAAPVDSPPEPSPAAADPSFTLTPAVSGAAGTAPPVKDFDGFQNLQRAAPRLDNQPLDPELKGFVKIPGTQTMVKLGGSARVDTVVDFENNGNPNLFIPSTIPVGSQPGVDGGERSTIFAKATRISLELRRPASESGKLRIYNENDFFADSSSNTMSFRVRHFYGQAWNFLIGQTFSGFMNPDAWPDVVDNQGPAGIINRRQAQIRYTQPLWDDFGQGQAYISAEYPESDVLSSTLPPDSQVRSILPDLVVGGRWEGGFGHIQLAGIGRTLGSESDIGPDGNTLGWGASLSGNWEMDKCNELFAQIAYGEGIARYVNDFNGNDLDAAWVGNDLKAIPIFAPMIGYTHRWSDHFRSTVAASWVMADLPSSVSDLTPETTASISANLVWQPTDSFRMGLEYLNGYKETYDGSEGFANRLNFVFRYDLVK